MVDETKPPKGWREEEPCAPGDEWAGDETGWLREETLADTLADAHRIAREEAQPYIVEALERIAAWFDDEGCNGEAAIDLRAFASGGRPLPGGKP